MQFKQALVSTISILTFLLFAASSASGVILSIDSAEIDAIVGNTVSVDVTVDDPSEIVGAAFTVIYDTTDLDLVSVESNFFDTFFNQYSTLPGAGNPFVDPQDGKTYIPITNAEGTVNVPLEITVDGNTYAQPLLIGPETQTGTKLVAARVQPGSQDNTLFTLTFDISAATEREYLVEIIQTRISNANAGYDIGGEPIPILIGAFDFEQRTFPDIPIEQINAGVISVIRSSGPEISNKPVEPLIVEAGASSGIFTVTAGNGSDYSWTVTDENGSVIDNQTGNSYVFTAPSTEAFAGVYTVAVTDNHGFMENFQVNVPITITPETLSFTEIKLDGDNNPQIFTVGGADGDYLWEILESAEAAQAVLNSDDYGIWESPSPVFNENTNVLNPADVESWQSFYIRVTVINDDGLTEANGLNRRVVGPFTLVPVGTFTVSLEDNNGNLEMNKTGDITVREVSTSQIRDVSVGSGEVSFLLPDVGGTFQYQVQDVRTPPTYIEQRVTSNAKHTRVSLDRTGVNSISGVVEDVDGYSLENAAVLVYHPSVLTKRYETTTSADGSYTVYLPVGSSLNGWVVVASHEDYLPKYLEDQAVGSVNFTGSTYGLHSETVITNIIATVIDSSIRFDITAKPAITDPREVDIFLNSGNGVLSPPVITDNIELGSTVTVTYNKVNNFVITASVDTSEDHDPLSGYAASRSFTYKGHDKLKASAQVYYDNNGVKAKLSANNQTAEVEIPAGGIATESTIIVEQFLEGGSVSTSYAYDVTAVNILTGMALSEDDINYVEITLPVDLSIIKPGDFEKSTWVIRHAKDLTALEAGDFTVEPYSHLISTDYVGDGQTGSITFYVTSLSIFDIFYGGLLGISGEGGAESGPGITGQGEDACFISSASYGSFVDFYAGIKQKIRDIYQQAVE